MAVTGDGYDSSTTEAIARTSRPLRSTKWCADGRQGLRALMAMRSFASDCVRSGGRASHEALSKLSASGGACSGCGAPLVSWRLTWLGRDIPPCPDRLGRWGLRFREAWGLEDERTLMEATEVRGGRVLVVDDDPDVREAVETALELDGHRVTTATDGLAALKRLGQAEFDAVVLDVLMPNLDGFEVCRRLRTSGNRTPVLILTARDSEADTIRGLDLGADDYLVKPFGLGELLARVRALLRRTRPVGEDAPLWFAGLSLDQQTREATRGGRKLELTRTEYALLELFLRNPRQVLTREVIMERVWNYDFGPTSNPLEVYISYLRRKTEAGGEPRLIHTVRGVGYALREP
jgi:two-component system response regulator MprA